MSYTKCCNLKYIGENHNPIEKGQCRNCGELDIDYAIERTMIGNILFNIIKTLIDEKREIASVTGLRDCLDIYTNKKISNNNIIQLMKYSNLWPSTEVNGLRFDLVGVE